MGEIEDDYGLESLVFVYKNLKNDLQKSATSHLVQGNVRV